MSGFADLVDSDTDSAPTQPAQKKSFADLIDPPSKSSSPLAPTFQTTPDKAAAMRSSIAASGNSALLQSFDRQFPGAAGPQRLGAQQLAELQGVATPQELAALGGTPAPVAVAVAPTATPPTVVRTGAAQIPGYEQSDTAPQTASPSLWDRAIGVGEAGLHAITGMAGGVAGTAAAGNTIAKQVLAGVTGAPLSPDLQGEAVQRSYDNAAQQFTYQPRTQAGQDATDALEGNKLYQSLPALAGVAHTIPSGGSAATAQAGRATIQAMRNTFAERALRASDATDRAEPTGSPGTSVTATQPNPLSAAQTASSNSLTPSSAFEDLPKNGSSALPQEVQNQRAQVLQSVGLDAARKSALAGDGPSAATDAQSAKLGTPAGRAMYAQLKNERDTMNSYADSLVRDTGGTAVADQNADYARGTNISTALDSIKDWYDGNISNLYGVANKRAAGVPTSLDTFANAMNDPSHLTNSDRIALKPALASYVKKAGMSVGDDGQISGTVAQAETVRKYLNEQWSPQNSKFIGTLKDAIDDDVTKSAGDDVYAAARQMRTDRANTLDNPNGISKIMDSSGPNGMNRAVPTEKIPTVIASMPVDQLTHVVNTLRNAPEEVQPQAQTALSEIKAHFANQIRNIGSSQAGQFNAKDVGSYLRANAARMAPLFSPDEMQNFQNLHQAGQILAKDQSYPGAAVQEHNLLQSGLMLGLHKGATGLGAFVGGVPGAVVGDYIGGKAAKAVGDKASLKAAQGRLTRLSDFPQ